MRLVSSRPARPTNGSPVRSSCSPGASPTKSRSAVGSPTPNTTWVRVAASGHLVHESASRSRSANEANGDGWRSDTVGPGLSGCRAMVRDRIADRLRRHLGDHHAQAIEVSLDRAGRDHEREIAVVTGVRRVDRTRHAVVRAAGQQVALDLRAPGVGGDEQQRGVGPGARRVLLEGRGIGEARRVGRRAGADEQAAVAPRRCRRPRSPPRSHRPPRRRHVLTRCRARPWCRARPPATWPPGRRGRHRRAPS